MNIRLSLGKGIGGEDASLGVGYQGRIGRGGNTLVPRAGDFRW